MLIRLKRYNSSLKSAARVLQRSWLHLVQRWRTYDTRYGFKWCLFNFVTLVIMLAGIFIPIAQEFYQTNRYQLSADALKLVGSSNQALTKQLTYDSSRQLYQFNKAGITNSNVPAAIQKASIGTPADKNSSTYALDVPQDFSQGVTYHDVNSQLSFSLIPQFSAMAGKQVSGHLVFPLDGGNQAIYSLKGNGLKEDIVVPQVTSDSMSFSYKLQLPNTLLAKVIPDSEGAIGIYSADPSLFGNISYGSAADEARVQAARVTGAKTHLVFGLPSPIVKAADGRSAGQATARFALSGTSLSVIAENLSTTKGPITIDPSVTVDSTLDFQTSGNNESNIDFSTSGQINRAGLTGGSATAANWTSGGTLGTAVSQGSTVAYNGYLYMIGGLNGSTVPVNTVQYAALTGGSIGTWTTTTSFTTARSGAATVVYNGYLYVLGGLASGALYESDAQYAKLTATGVIATDSGCGSAWCATTGFSIGRANFGAAAYNGDLYIYGGTTNGAAATADVQFAPVNADGGISATTWHYTHSSTDDNSTQTSSLSGTGRYSFGSTIYNGYLYLVGGRDASTLYSDVQYAPINSNGTIGSWTTTTSFTTIRYLLGAVAYNGYLYVAGGFTGSVYKSDVQYAPINSNGSIGAWSTTTVVGSTRSSPGLMAYNGYLYSVGGYSGTPQTATYYIKIDAAGQTQAFANVKDGAAANFTGIRSLDCSVTYNGYLYVIAGSNDDIHGNLLSTAYTALGANGSLTLWGGTTALPSASFTSGLGQMGCTIYNGYIYVIGGQDGGTALAKTFYAPLSASTGAIGTWVVGTVLPDTALAPGAIAYNGNLYQIGGQQTVDTKIVRYAPLNAGTGAIGAWTATSSLHDSFAYSGVTMVGQYMYNIAGTSSSSNSNGTSEVQYALINADGTLGTWAVATAPLTAARSFLSATTVNGCIYAMGGEDVPGATKSDVYYACPTTSGNITSWATASSLAAATTDTAVTSYRGYIYVVGGYTTIETTNTEAALVNNGGTGVAGSWSAATSFTTARYAHSSVVYNGYLYVLGGRSSSSALTPQADVQYAKLTTTGTIATDSGCGSAWCTTSSFTNARYYQSAVVYNGYLYMLGGYDGSYYNDVQYAQLTSTGAIATDSGCGSAWCTTSSFSTGRYGQTAVVYNGYLYVSGGYSGSYRNDVQYAKLTTTGTIATDSGCGSAWCTTTSFTTARDNHSSVVYNGYLYIIGGYSGSEQNGVQYAQLTSIGAIATDSGCGSAWCTTTNFSVARDSLNAVAYNGYLYIMGGTSGSVQGDVQYAPINRNGTIGTWATTTSFSTARSAASSAVYNGYLYILGGINGSGTTLSDVQSSALSSPSRTARYSRLVDLTAASSVNSMTYNASAATLASGAATITVRPAGTSPFNFGAAINSTQVGAAAAAASCTHLGISDTRYLLVTIVLDDSQTGIFGDGNSSLANITDFTVNYTPVHAKPNIRLRAGQTLQNGNLTGLDVCGP